MSKTQMMPALLGLALTCCGATSLFAGEDPPPFAGGVAAATTQPTSEAMPRRMMWDRTKDALDAARRVESMQQNLKDLADQAAKHPNDANLARSVENAQRALEFLRNENAEKLTRWKTPGAIPGPPKLEKAAYLGVVTSPATPVLQKQLRLAPGMGLLVDYVEPGSPAESAGLQPFDVVVKLNEQILVNAHQLAVLVRTFEPGAKVTLKVIREGKERSLDVTLVEREVKPLSSVVFGPTWSYVPPSPPAAQRTSNPRSRDTQIRQGDLVNLTVLDLEGPGLQTFTSSRVGKDGTIRAPYLRRPITAEGLSEMSLQKCISDAYRTQAGHEISGVAVERIPSADALGEVGG